MPAKAEPDQAQGFSLWLMPEGEPHDRLAAWIERLSARYRTRPFQPHLTLLAGVTGSQADLLDAARRAARSLAPFVVHCSGVEGREQHFRCLFLRAVLDQALRGAQERTARAFAREPEASFLPHVSLVYGSLLPEQKAAVTEELRALGALSFEVGRLHVWRTEGRVPDWRELGAFALLRR